MSRPASSSAAQGAGGAPRPQRKINTARCLYPKCTACLDHCPSESIDFSGSPPVVKPTCTQCRLCEKLCAEDAIEFEGGRPGIEKVIDMEKCTYPRCTLCLDHCPMHSIDFLVNPPVFKSNCEEDNLCWVICPQGAIEIPNMEGIFGARAVGREHAFLKLLEQAEAKAKFRRLTPLDQVGWDNPVWKVKKTPRYVIEED